MVDNFQWLSNTVTLLLITGLVVAAVHAVFDEGGRFPIAMRQAVVAVGHTIDNLRWAGAAIPLVLAPAYVMNLSGQIVAIGTWLDAAKSVMPRRVRDRGRMAL